MSDKIIDSFVIDAFKEIANIAAGHMSEVISQFAENETSISLPTENILLIDEAAHKVAGNDKTLLVGYMSVLGDVSGSVIFLLSKDDALKLTEFLMKCDVDPAAFPSEMENDVLSEIMTIASNAYLTAITQTIGVLFISQEPVISTFDAFNLLNFLENMGEPAEEFKSREVVMVSVKYSIDGTGLDGEFLMLVGPSILDCLEEEIKKIQC